MTDDELRPLTDAERRAVAEAQARIAAGEAKPRERRPR